MKTFITVTTLFFLQKIAFCQLIITGALPGDTTLQHITYEIDTIRTNGDSAFCDVRMYENSTLVHEEQQIFISEKKSKIILHGITEQWHKDGSKKLIGRFEYGEKKGLWKYWDEDGHEIKEEDLYPRRNADYYIDGIKVKTSDSKK